VPNRRPGSRRKPATTVVTVRPPGMNRAATSTGTARRCSRSVAQTRARRLRGWRSSRPIPSRPAPRPSRYARVSPSTAPRAAATISSGSERCPLAASTPPLTTANSPGISGKTASPATSSTTSGYAHPASDVSVPSTAAHSAGPSRSAGTQRSTAARSPAARARRARAARTRTTCARAHRLEPRPAAARSGGVSVRGGVDRTLGSCDQRRPAREPGQSGKPPK
jgi:hypothetical protein